MLFRESCFGRENSLSSATISVSSAKSSVSPVWHINTRPRGPHWVLSPELGEGQKTHAVLCLKPCFPWRQFKGQTRLGVTGLRASDSEPLRGKSASERVSSEDLWKPLKDLWKPLKTSEDLWKPSLSETQRQISLSEALGPVAPIHLPLELSLPKPHSTRFRTMVVLVVGPSLFCYRSSRHRKLWLSSYFCLRDHWEVAIQMDSLVPRYMRGGRVGGGGGSGAEDAEMLCRSLLWPREHGSVCPLGAFFPQFCSRFFRQIWPVWRSLNAPTP